MIELGNAQFLKLAVQFVIITCFKRQMERKFYDSVMSWMIIYSDTEILSKVIYKYNRQKFIRNDLLLFGNFSVF